MFSPFLQKWINRNITIEGYLFRIFFQLVRWGKCGNKWDNSWVKWAEPAQLILIQYFLFYACAIFTFRWSYVVIFIPNTSNNARILRRMKQQDPPDW